MDLRVRMVGCNECDEGILPRIKVAAHFALFQCGVLVDGLGDDEAVVDVRVDRSEGECLKWSDILVSCWSTGWDSAWMG